MGFLQADRDRRCRTTTTPQNYGDPLWVYYQYRLAKGDTRSKDAIYAEGRQKMKEVEERGVDLAIGHGEKIWDLNPKLAAKVNGLYDDAKQSLWAELTPEFIATVPESCRSAPCPRTATTISPTRIQAKR